MANTQSDVISTILGTPPVSMLERNADGARVRACVATLSITAAFTTNDIAPLCRLKATDAVISIQGQGPAITGASDYDVGVYTAADWNEAAGTAVDVDLFIEGGTMAAADDTLGDMVGIGNDTAGGTVDGPLSTGKSIGQMLVDKTTLSALPDPGTQYDVCVTFLSDPAAAGEWRFLILYTSGD